MNKEHIKKAYSKIVLPDGIVEVDNLVIFVENSIIIAALEKDETGKIIDCFYYIDVNYNGINISSLRSETNYERT